MRIISNLPDKEFRVMVINILTRRRMGEHHDNFNKEIKKVYKETPNQNHRMKNTINELKNTPERLNNKLNETEEIINEVEDRVVKLSQSEKQKEF